MNSNKGILIISTKMPDLFWYLITNIKETRLHLENCKNNITDDDTKSILLLSGVKKSLYDEFVDDYWGPNHDSGWGYSLEKFLKQKYQDKYHDINSKQN
jgi:hypothetical protein